MLFALLWILCGIVVWIIKARDPRDPWDIHGNELVSLLLICVAGPLVLIALILIRAGYGLQIALGILHRRINPDYPRIKS